MQMVGPGDAWRLRELLDIASTYAGAPIHSSQPHLKQSCAGCGATRAIVDSELERRARALAGTALGGVVCEAAAVTSLAQRPASTRFCSGGTCR